MRYTLYKNLISNLKYKLFFTKLFKSFIILLILNNTELFFQYRILSNYISSFYFFSKRITHLNSICLLSGRARGVCFKYSMSRFIFRYLTNSGMLIGYTRKS